jgi:hypothetical protein
MALPTVMSLGTRIIFWPPYSPSIPPPGAAPITVPPIGAGGVAPIPQNVVGVSSGATYPGMTGNGPFVGLCSQVGGATPDFIGSTAVIHDARGTPFLVQLGVNTATWTSGGSQPMQQHWSFVDLTA